VNAPSNTIDGVDAEFTVVAPSALDDAALTALAGLLLDCAEAERPEKPLERPGDCSEVLEQ
jgi:hypothetical protein